MPSEPGSPRRRVGRPPTLLGRRPHHMGTSLHDHEKEVFEALCERLGVKSKADYLRDLIMRDAAANGVPLPREPQRQLALPVGPSPGQQAAA